MNAHTLIYFIEKHPCYLTLIRPLFEAIHLGRFRAMSSTLSLFEVLVQPVRARRFDLVQQCRRILLGSPHFELIPVDVAVSQRGAHIRAEHGFKTPDSLQLASAMEYRGADAFLTNDAQLRRFDQLDVVILDDLLASGSD